ncbi:MAG: helix-turn-helix transcriptional regulator [Rhodobacteraceae bacterium]|nr:helix-turn-helix transcriptional regulator [Paracoccaceae bacterium]
MTDARPSQSPIRKPDGGDAVPDDGAAGSIEEIVDRSEEAVAFLKALGHGGRLRILCHLISGEKTVSELEALLGLTQSGVSQQLARLRLEGLVQSRRDGHAIHYSITDPKVIQLVALLGQLFCTPADPA